MNASALPATVDVAVIGGGPAGLAAATVTAQAGLATLLVDENPGLGGQIYRAITTSPLKDRRVLGEDYWQGLELVDAVRRSGAVVACNTTVWSLDPDRVLGLSTNGVAQLVSARQIIVATGALERPFPIAGWTLPGVMTAGAAQGLLKGSGMVPDGPVVMAGSGPLLWLLAAQLIRAGGKIDVVLDTTPSWRRVTAIPHAAGFLLSPLLRKGLALMREVRRSVRVVADVSELTAEGGEHLERVGYRVGTGDVQQVAARHLLLHQGVAPNVNLAMSAGIEHRWDPVQLCWSPVLDDSAGTSVPGISIAGDGAGIAGAWAAEARGRIAGIAACGRLGVATGDEQEARQALRRHLMGRGFLDRYYQPRDGLRLPEGATIVCRCEEVTAEQVRQTVRLGCEGPNQMKAFLRCGMGPCQGRLCGLTVTELIAAERGVRPADVGYYRLRPPVKPILLTELAGLPASESAVKAVARG